VISTAATTPGGVIIAETVAGILEEGFGERDQLLMAMVDQCLAGLQKCLADVEIPNGLLRERVSVVVEAA
jgi:hypothetical protein